MVLFATSELIGVIDTPAHDESIARAVGRKSTHFIAATSLVFGHTPDNSPGTQGLPEPVRPGDLKITVFQATFPISDFYKLNMGLSSLFLNKFLNKLS
jgi:hypothetical protein